tara:strand:+ start:761 stop:1375 length:615 start_codon:yes stop_codon:yes gene_type:complete
MINSKTSGLMMAAGFTAFIVMTVSQFLQGGDNQGTAESLAWAASSDDWKWIMPIRMVAIMLMLVFTAGFTSWARTLCESSGVIYLGTRFTLLGAFLMFVALISSGAGFDVASDSADPAEAAHALIKLSGMSSWFGGISFAFSLFLVGTKLYIDKLGTPALNGLIALLGIIAVAGGFINWFIWVICFGIALLILAIIGVQKVIRD